LRQIELNDYPNEEFLHLDWHTSGALANGSGANRGSFYGVGGVPDVFFDGYDHVVGASDSNSVYNAYKARITNHLNDPAYSDFLLDAEVNFSPGTSTGALTIDVEVAPGHTITNPSDVHIRAAVYESGIQMCCEPRTGNDIWNFIGRAQIVNQVLTISNAGEQQQVSQNFALDPSWNAQNLEAVVWLQRTSNKRIHQAAKALKPYGVTVVNLDPAVTSTPGDPVDFDTQVTYTGSTDDDVVVTLDKAQLPAGWAGELRWGAVTDPDQITIPAMTQGQTEDVTIRVTPDATAGLGIVTASTTPVSNPGLAVVIDYATFSNTPAVLYVDDDSGENWGPYLENALIGAGYPFLSREVLTAGEPAVSDLLGYDAVIWSTGWANFNTILADGQAALMAYLDAGGSLFLSSQGVLAHLGIGTFTRDYLGVAARTLFQGATSAVGVAGDPIGDGLAFALNPPFGDLADVMTPGLGTTWLVAPSGNIGVHYDSGTFRTVFMSAAFEGVPPGDDALVMQRIVGWLLNLGPTDVRPAEGAATLSLALRQNTPNPFTGTTRLSFALPAAGPVRLAVYDVAGRHVVDLVDRVLPRGEHAVVWNGADAAGRPVASGVYLYRLKADGQSLSRGMVLRR